MNDFIKALNDNYNGKEMFDWHDHDFVFIDKKEDTVLYDLVHKALSSNFKNLVCEKNIADCLFLDYSKELNVFIRCLLSFLLACSKNHYKNSNLVADCEELIKLYFEHIHTFKEKSPVHILERVIRWTLFKFPISREDISNLLFSYITSGDKTFIRYSSTLHYLLNSKGFLIFLPEQLQSLFEYFYTTKVEQNEFYYYYEFFNRLVARITDINPKTKKMYFKYIVDFVLKNICFMDQWTKQIELQKVLDMMDFAKCYSDEDYYLVRDELEKANKACQERLTYHDFKAPKHIVDQISEKKKEFYSFLEHFKNDEKIIIVLDYISVFHIEQLKKDISVMKQGVFAIFKENVLDADGRVINYKDLDSKQQFSLDASTHIKTYVSIMIEMILQPFFVLFEFDEEAEKLIKTLLNKCDSIANAKIDRIFKLLSLFFTKDFENSVYGLVLEFEDILRNYFKRKKLNIYKKDGSRDLIGLGNIFNNNDTNKFRDTLLEIIDEDYYFTLKWLLTDEYGFGLRDKISHSINSEDLFNNIYSIFAVLYIFKLILAL